MKKFNIRKGLLEVRSCDRHLTDKEEHDRAAIVAWTENGERCYTLAYFIPQEDGFDLKFVRDRPFNISWYDFFQIAKMGYKLLTEEIKD